MTKLLNPKWTQSYEFLALARHYLSYDAASGFIYARHTYGGRRKVLAGSRADRLTRNRVPCYMVCFNGHNYHSSRLAWFLHHGLFDDYLVVDHVDGNRLNNTLDNLRLVDHSVNAINKPIQKNNRSGHPGIELRVTKTWKAYRATINWQRQRHTVGHYKTIEEAVAARDKYIEQLGLTPFMRRV